jgi:lysozyme
MLGGLAGMAAPALSGCGGRPASVSPSYYMPAPGSGEAYRPSVEGLDAVIDISNNVTVGDFRQVRRAGILGVIHKCTEGGDWIDPSYSSRRAQAEQSGLLWGAYHFGTRQYSGSDQAMAFLAIARPGPQTLMALDLEPNERNPRNTMQIAQAEAFVQVVYQQTGRLPLLYTHPKWANGERFGKHRLSLGQPVTPGSVLARCDLWLADYREEPEVPYAWANKGWRLWQYVADETEADAAYGTTPRAIPGISHCDRNLFKGDESQLYRYWRSGGRTA